MYVFYLSHGGEKYDIYFLINYQSPYILINPYGHKGSEFAPIVIYVHIYTLYFIQKREARLAILLSRFIYDREYLIDHEKHATLQIRGTEISERLKIQFKRK